MGSIAEIIEDLNFGRNSLLKATEGLSWRERVRTEVYPNWSVKDIFAHIIGWDERALNNLPLMLADRADEIEAIDATEYNRRSVEAWREKGLKEVVEAMQTGHQKLIDLIATIDHKEIDKRRERQGRIVTIRSYILNMIMEHDRQHASDIETWRKEIDQRIDPEALQKTLRHHYDLYMQKVESLTEAEMNRKRVIGHWSIKDMTGHIGDWKRLMLQAAEHIYDPSLPDVTMHGSNVDEQNKMMAARREMNPISMELRYLRNLQKDWEMFIAKLNPADWRLRGPYPWPEHGTIAQLVEIVAEHYQEHLEMIEAWQKSA